MRHPEGHVSSEIEHGIATIEFFHPSSNSLPANILDDLAKTINELGTNNRVHVIILRSAGNEVFCSGSSLNELSAISNVKEGKKFFNGFANVINEMRKCKKFILCRVQGKTIGGGIGLIAASDYAFTVKSSETDKHSIKLSELTIGIGPFVVGPAIERKIGTSCYQQLAIDATNWRSAEWGKTHGLFSEVHNNEFEMDSAITTLAEKLAHYSPDAMAQLKKVFWQGTEDWDTLLATRAEISANLIVGDFPRVAIAKLLGKAIV